jgi:hypothetical protein
MDFKVGDLVRVVDPKAYDVGYVTRVTDVDIHNLYVTYKHPERPENDARPFSSFVLVEEGWKDDKDKRLWSLLLGQSLIEAVESVVDVLQFGAKKYAPDNWIIVEDGSNRYYNALLRHLVEYRKGQYLDPESGQPVLAHVVCCALFLLALHLKEQSDK